MLETTRRGAFADKLPLIMSPQLKKSTSRSKFILDANIPDRFDV